MGEKSIKELFNIKMNKVDVIKVLAEDKTFER